MQTHFHSGIVSVLFAGVSAIIVMNLVRFVAAQLVENEGTETLGKSLGALVTFSN